MKRRQEAEKTKASLTPIAHRLRNIDIASRSAACAELVRMAEKEIKAKMEDACSAFAKRGGDAGPGAELTAAIIHDLETTRNSAKLNRAIENLMDANEALRALSNACADAASDLRSLTQ